MGAVSLLGLLIPGAPGEALTALFFFLAFPVISVALLLGGFGNLPYVETSSCGGLLVTLILSCSPALLCQRRWVWCWRWGGSLAFHHQIAVDHFH